MRPILRVSTESIPDRFRPTGIAHLRPMEIRNFGPIRCRLFPMWISRPVQTFRFRIFQQAPLPGLQVHQLVARLRRARLLLLRLWLTTIATQRLVTTDKSSRSFRRAVWLAPGTRTGIRRCTFSIAGQVFSLRLRALLTYSIIQAD